MVVLLINAIIEIIRSAVTVILISKYA